MKPFYRDSLFNLRRVLELVLKETIRSSHQYPKQAAPELRKKKEGASRDSIEGKSVRCIQSV
jgi:hypothetical protein